MTLIFDAHADIWTDIAQKKKSGMKDPLFEFHLPRLKEGKIFGVNAVVWIDPFYKHKTREFLKILSVISQSKLKKYEDFVFVETYQDIEKAIRESKIFILSSVEGLSAIDDPEYLYILSNLSIKVVSLTWNEKNIFGAGSKISNRYGLTKIGKQTISIIEETGMILDVSHLNERTFWDVVKTASKPFIATHSNVYKLCPVTRNLKDEQIKVIAEGGGIIGINSLANFVDLEEPTIEKYVDHIVYVADLVGIEYVGLGFDFCDFFGEDIKTTKGLENTSKAGNVLQALKDREFSENEIELISYRNFLNFFKDNLKA